MDANGSWSISVTQAGIATIKANGTNTRNTIYYNNGTASNLLFSCYSTAQKTVSIYKKVTLTELEGKIFDDPVTGETEYGIYAEGAPVQTYAKGTDLLTREYTTDGALLTFAIVTPAEDLTKSDVLVFGNVPATLAKGAEFTLTLTRKTGMRVRSSAEYAVTVVREDGAKVWLADGEGNGFIIKK